MIVKIIAKYLESHKRLVVPNLGTFIVKDAGHKILFSNLMKSDDGVLRALLVEHGVSELEAAGTIDRFVFEVNFRLDRDGVCGLDGFGALKRGGNGVIAFITNPAAQGEVLDGGLQEHLAERQNVAPADEVKDELPKAQEQPADDVDEEDIVIKVVPRNAAPGRRSSALQEEEKLTVSTQKRPAHYVKGLRYGRGGKIITGREYATSRKSSKGDIFIKIAIAVAVLAIMAILYGVWCEWQNMQYDEPEINSEETSLFDTESVEKGVENPDLQYTTPKQ